MLIGGRWVSPYFPYLKAVKKVLSLCQNINDSGPVFLDCVTEDGKELYRKVGKWLDRWDVILSTTAGFPPSARLSV